MNTKKNVEIEAKIDREIQTGIEVIAEPEEEIQVHHHMNAGTTKDKMIAMNKINN